MGDLYSRVYHLPRRLLAAREALARLHRRLEESDRAERSRIQAAIVHKHGRVVALEIEAARFGFHELLTERKAA
jgi:hypothetical protein